MSGTSMTVVRTDSYDDSHIHYNIGQVNFIFNWYGTDYGTTNNIKWYSKSALIFGDNPQTLGAYFIASYFNGFLMGFSTDRKPISATEFTPSKINTYNIKQIIVKHGNYITTDEIEMEIRLIRGSIYQYIEIVITQWYQNIDEKLTWIISNESSYNNILGVIDTQPPSTPLLEITPPKTYLLRSNLQGDDWTLDTTTDLNDLLNPIDAIIPTSITNPLQYERPIYNAKPSKTNFL
tara:strand:+ start:1372 stop:2076 length:705 start_codon:yes stop_codon:yes gene_type:complete